MGEDRAQGEDRHSDQPNRPGLPEAGPAGEWRGVVEAQVEVGMTFAETEAKRFYALRDAILGQRDLKRIRDEVEVRNLKKVQTSQTTQSDATPSD